jgi:hypothetical protein
VMSEQKDTRTKWLHVRLKPDEYIQLHKHFSKTTCRKLSDYSRKILLAKPVTTLYRNQSLDDFMAEMIKLRGELNAIGNNFNQAVKKLHTLQQIQEFKAWVNTHELNNQLLLKKVDDIKNQINKIADQWLQ